MPEESKLSTGGGSTSSSSSGSSFLSVASALSNPIGSIVSSIGNYFLNERRNKQAIEQWERENEYNLPKNQIQRLRDAGLNPALMYGEGASGLVSAASPEMTRSNLSIGGVDPLTAAQIANLNAQTEATRDMNARENELQPFNIQNLKSNNDVLAQKVKTLSSEEQLNYAKRTFTDSQRIINDKQCDELIKLWRADAAMKEVTKDFTAEQTRQLIALFDLKQQNLQLTNDHVRALIRVSDAEANRLIKALDVMTAQESLFWNQSGVAVNYADLLASQNIGVRRTNYWINILNRHLVNLQAAQADYFGALGKNALSHPNKSSVGRFVDDLFGDFYDR